MNLAEIKKLIEIFNSSSQIARLSIKQDNFELKLDKSNATALPVAPVSAMPAAHTTQVQAQVPKVAADPAPAQTLESSVGASKGGDFITSPMVGTFYHRPSPDADPYIKVGDVIKKGQTIGIIEAMKIMNEIEAEFDCKILAIETGDGQPVEFGSHLIKVEKV
ncbi:acetyl-CoA carboxylase biotin carboxyl carrier protein [Helicobacter sp.]|uniref:acetyl-CoA carboxylase biotin carboxyl carrier protein n=1 Tax=Helicobacter sp. TaxID=218 RepID=UPI0025BC8211|nr:acetyl-CoA carboxylase biotin carboxyl carrier protein [Helicobacter sp.]MBR2494034.1 acetyl-CoA carboxylase biotin carboxyl carrier protein [Helicobacter sp.]